MAFTPSTPPRPPTPPRTISYEVFLSFRGEDTRKTFVDHLYYKLLDKGIHTFKDDEDLEKGQRIEKLLQIIKESQFAIVVFSKNYASSKWCLEEIATIMECQQQYGKDKKIMMPIFYDVEPTDVRNQTKSFAESFKIHEKKENKEKLERWKEALKKAGDISGYHLKNEFDGYEGECVKRVANDILTTLMESTDASTSLQNNFMGLKSRVGDVSNLLRQEVQFIGIWGMGGIGKTKIASVVYRRFRMEFLEAYFFKDLKQYKITELEEMFLGRILKKKMRISNVGDGMKIKKRLQGKKVWMVLDGVDNVEQLEILAGGRDWFGKGSRVIITTRDRKVLVSHGVKCIYRVNEWDDKEAIQLFCWNAFKMKIPKTGFEELSQLIVPYAMGLPLALEVLGKDLFGRNVDYWESILKILKNVNSCSTPKDKIFKVLKISFDGLDLDNQNVFLHIACFFRNWREEYVKDVLDNDMHVLIDKSLISVKNGRIEMHDLIQEMGKHIASEEKPRRRAWQFMDVQDVLCKRMNEYYLIEGICWWERRLTIKITFKGMERLKMFKAGAGDNVCYVDENDNYFPSSLRWLEYEFYHFPSLPPRFESSNLVGLSLRKSSLLNCNFTEKLYKLTILDLSSSSSLSETPNFDGMPNLVRLNLSCCIQLEEIHPSIGNLEKLISLNLRKCSNFKKLPSFNHVSVSPLESLDLGFCKKLENFPEIKAKTSLLVELDLREVGIIQVPPSIQQLDALTKLSLDDCEHLASLPEDLCELKYLKILTIKNCRSLKALPENLDGLISLEYLNIQRSHFDFFPESFSQLTSLRYLDITECQNPNKLPKLPANITELYADCRFKIDLAIQCSKLVSVSYSGDDNPEVGTFLSEEFIHRENRLLVSYLITAAEENKLKMNQMLRSFKYRRYQSNGISIHLNSPWYSQKFVGFMVCFLSLEGDIWGPHSYQDIDQSMKQCTVRVKFSHKDRKNEFLQRKCVMAGLASEKSPSENEDVKGHVCFAFIPVRSLLDKSKAVKDYSSFEVQFMNLKASADWGCSLLYERQTGANERRYMHNGSHSGLTTDDIACLTLMELGETDYLNLNRLSNSPHLPEYCSLRLHRLGLRYFDISGCQTLQMPPTLPSAIREVYAHSNLASESTISQLASKYSELYSVSFSHTNNKAELNLSAEKLAKKFAHLPSQSRNSPFIVTYPTLTDIDTKRWFKYSSRHSNKVSINLNPSWYRQTFEGFVVHFLLKGRLHTWESHPNIRPFRHCEVIAKLIHKDNGNSVQTCCKIGRLYDEEFDFNKEEFMIWFAYIPFRSLSIPSAKANDYSVFEVAFRDTDSNNLSHCSCGLLYKNDKSLSEAIRSDANDLDEEAPNTEHSFEEASMATTQPGAIIGENPRHSNIKNGKKKKKRSKKKRRRNESMKKKIIQIKRRKMADHNICIEHSGGDDATTKDSSNSGAAMAKTKKRTHGPSCQKLAKMRKSNPASDSGCTTDVEPLIELKYLNLSLNEDICCDLQYRDISGCTKLPKLSATIRELYATYNKSLASESNIAKLATKYSELYNVAFSYPIDGDIAILELRELVNKFFPITKPFLNRNTPFIVTYPPQYYSDYKISTCFKYPNHDCHPINLHTISISLDPTWYRHNFVGFVVCFGFSRQQVRWESHKKIPSFRQCQLIAKLTHKDNRSEPPPLKTKCVIGRDGDEKFDGPDKDELVCFAYIPFNSLWPKSKAITDNITPNHYSVFEAAIPDLKMSRKAKKWCARSKTSTDITTPNWSCDLLYTDDESLTKAIREKRDVDSFYKEVGSSESNSVNGKEKEREDEQRKKAHLNNDNTPSSSKQNKKTRHQSSELSVIGTQHSIVGDDVLQHLGDNCKYLVSLLKPLPHDEVFDLKIDQTIFHTNTRSIFVAMNAINELMTMKCLDVSIIQAFILFLNQLCNQRQVTSIGFVCPTLISADTVKRNVSDFRSYLNHVMKQHENKQFILAPYNQKYHWLLLVICIRSKSIYVLDPLLGDCTIEIEDTFNEALHSDIHWKPCKCRKQPGEVECGYYVMRYMFEIVTKYLYADCLDKAFESTIPYSIKEINEIRELWAKYFLKSQTEEGSVFTQLGLVTGEAEHSEQTPVDEDCEAEVEANK